MAYDVRVAAFDELDARTAYLLWQLRESVFVVEQECPYPELDGRDLEPGTRHVWAASEGGPIGYLRILDDGDHARIGRVLVVRSHRGQGLSGDLMRTALDVIGGRPSVLDAQSTAGRVVRDVRLRADRSGVPRRRHPARADAATLGGGEQRGEAAFGWGGGVVEQDPVRRGQVSSEQTGAVVVDACPVSVGCAPVVHAGDGLSVDPASAVGLDPVVPASEWREVGGAGLARWSAGVVRERRGRRPRIATAACRAGTPRPGSAGRRARGSVAMTGSRPRPRSHAGRPPA